MKQVLFFMFFSLVLWKKNVCSFLNFFSFLVKQLNVFFSYVLLFLWNNNVCSFFMFFSYSEAVKNVLSLCGFLQLAAVTNMVLTVMTVTRWLEGVCVNHILWAWSVTCAVTEMSQVQMDAEVSFLFFFLFLQHPSQISPIYMGLDFTSISWVLFSSEKTDQVAHEGYGSD